MTSPGQQHDAVIELAAYDHRWPSMFQQERSLLDRSVGHWLAGPIEHVGSTAVPGLMAKPVIDIMAPVADLETSRPAIEVLTNLDAGQAYVHYPYRAAEMHWFCKPSPTHRTHHLHLVPLGSRMWIEKLAFRDCLQAEPMTAAAYARLKQKLAHQHATDREAYTQAKGDFISQVLARVLD